MGLDSVYVIGLALLVVVKEKSIENSVCNSIKKGTVITLKYVIKSKVVMFTQTKCVQSAFQRKC